MRRSKLYFYYGAMESAKSANLIMRVYKKKLDGRNVLVLKSPVDERDKGIIKSRALPTSIQATLVPDTASILAAVLEKMPYPDHVYVDEVNFLTPDQVEMLSTIVDVYDVPVTCYGLLTDFRGKLFPGSQRLVELADTIREVTSECACGRKATRNMRVLDGIPTFDGEQVLVGGEESYRPVCRQCYREALLGGGIPAEGTGH